MSRFLTDILTGVQLFPDKPSSAFVLGKNYPNPFSSSTNIKYSLSVKSNISLTVYNAGDQKVATLVHALQEAGNYSVNWNTSNLPGGIYFYNLSVTGAKNFTQTRKMVLVK